MRRHAADHNQEQIVDDLRKAGVSVVVLSQTGGGCPDLLVSYNHATMLLEVKEPKEKLSPSQVAFHRDWQGEIHIVRSSLEAINAVFYGSVLGQK